MDQDMDPARYEVVVVDNNSTDGTRQAIEAFTGKTPRVTYLFEPRQGVSYGRNTGIQAASAPVIAFTDDDVRVSRSWLSTILAALAEHPEAACVGGRVLPAWPQPCPAWLGREHWGPLGLLDYGEQPLQVNASRRLCLITANAAYRREIFDRIGMFSPHVQAVGREVATEDHEILLRLWRAGGQGLYWPALTATADVVAERMQRRYHRRWHRRHGRFSAIMHDEEMEKTRIGRFLGVPAHRYRQAAGAFGRWLARLARLDGTGAFNQELELWSGLGFLTTRWAEFLSGGGRADKRAG
jgi:glucosyl-dolichyl phosphate glucuronosyltransferase